MTTIQAQTRQALRRAVGYQLLGPRFIVSTFVGTGTTTTGGDTTLRGGDRDYIGSWLVFAGGTDTGSIASVTAFDETGGTLEGQLTFTPTNTNADTTAAGVGYEMWPDEYPPAYINNLIDGAIRDATGVTFDPEEDITVHLLSDVIRYNIPAEFTMINRLEVRDRVQALVVESCDAVWDTIDTDVTGSADTQIKTRGNASLKLVVGAGAAAGDDLATQVFASGGTDMSFYTHLEGWVRCTTTLSAADLNILLSDSGGIEETLAVPAVGTADVWQYFRIAFVAPQENTTISTVAIDYTVDGGAYTVWFDELLATRADDWNWRVINQREWKVDKEARDIVFNQFPDYGLLKITGGNKPALLSSDTATSEISDRYIVDWVMATVKQQDFSVSAAEKQIWAQRQQLAFGSLRKYPNQRRTGP